MLPPCSLPFSSFSISLSIHSLLLLPGTFSSVLLNELSFSQYSTVPPFFSYLLFVCSLFPFVSFFPVFLPSFLSLSPPWGLHCYISNVNDFPSVISPSPSSSALSIFISPFHFLQGHVPPPLFLLSLLSSCLTPSFPYPLLLWLHLSSQWAQPRETPVLFVAAERGMGNDVAFSSVAGRQTGE